MSKATKKTGKAVIKGRGTAAKGGVTGRTTWATRAEQPRIESGTEIWEPPAGERGTFKQGTYASRPAIGSSEKKKGIMGLDAAFMGLFSLSANDKIQYIKKGISKNELINIKDKIGLDYEALGKILSVSRATLLNKKPTQKFDQSTSEKIMLLADVVSYGLNAFEDKDRFNDWLKRPNKALGEQSPLEKMDTVYGIQEVKNEIGRIEYGVY